MKNDIGEATLLWMMTHNKLKRPRSFKQMNPWLSDVVIQKLEKNFAGTASNLPTANKPECADTILDICQPSPGNSEYYLQQASS